MRIAIAEIYNIPLPLNIHDNQKLPILCLSSLESVELSPET